MKNKTFKQPLRHAKSVAALQKKNRTMWDEAPMIREQLKAELVKAGIELSGEDHVLLHTIAAQFLGWKKLKRGKPPEAAAVETGRFHWVKPIVNFCKQCDAPRKGRPRDTANLKALIRIVRTYKRRPVWKEISKELKYVTGSEKSPDACRSAFRRSEKRRMNKDSF